MRWSRITGSLADGFEITTADKSKGHRRRVVDHTCAAEHVDEADHQLHGGARSCPGLCAIHYETADDPATDHGTADDLATDEHIGHKRHVVGGNE